MAKMIITKARLRDAQLATSRSKALPDDWSSWFPSCIQLALDIKSPEITAGHILRYALLRLSDDDVTRYLEAAQCLLLLYQLGAPTSDTVVTTYESV